MNKLTTTLIGAALLFVSTSVLAQPSYYAVKGIPDASSLVLRAWPSSGSKPVANIPHNASKIETTGKQIEKEGKQWRQVIFQNNVGWAEADYLSEMSNQTQQAATPASLQPETINAAAEFNYSGQTQVAGIPAQSIPDNIPWTAEQDTIYHDPTGQQLSGPNGIETVEAKHTLVVINKNAEEGDLRGENLAGNRYENIEASMSVMYQP